MINSIKHILLFDGECALCNGLVEFVIRNDSKGKFKFAPLKSEPGIKVLESGRLYENELDTFVYCRNNRFYFRSTAAIYLLFELGGLWKIFYALLIVPPALRDLVYNAIAYNRYKIFGRTKNCINPSLEITSRFLK
jgi:predicted DCC family thiol-disulfide oxidoreductase YuxK